MKNITRKKFIGTTAKGLAAAWALSQLPQQLFAQLPKAFNDIPIGFQTFPIREMLAKDFAGTLKMMAAQGYKVVEMCSPKGYEKIGYGPLVSMKTSDMRQIITDAGLTCPSCHFGFAEFADDKLDASIEFAKGLGLSHMICSTFWIQDTARLNDYLVSADKLNKAAEKIKKAGMQAGFHNHSFEFTKLDGQLVYDALMSRFDPDLVKMQFQTEVINLGYKAADYLKNIRDVLFQRIYRIGQPIKNKRPLARVLLTGKNFLPRQKQPALKLIL